jgi:hypothetical protein
VETWVGISMVICAVAFLKWVQSRTSRKGLGPGPAEALEARMSQLEQRLGDVQEVMLSVDEKLDKLVPSGP